MSKNMNMKKNRTNFQIFSLLILFLGSMVVQGQSLWPVRGGGDQPDSGRSIAYSINDNVFVTGTFETSVDDSGVFGDLDAVFTTNSYSTDIYVGKTDEIGKWLWVATIQGSGTEISYGIAVDDNENVYITGTTNGAITFTNMTDKNHVGTVSSVTLNSTVDQAFIAKLDSDGEWEWAKSIGSDSASEGKGVAVYPGSFGSTNVYICGEYNGTASFGGLDDLTTSHVTGYVAMLKGGGAWKWARQVDGSGVNTINDITVSLGGSTEGTERPFIHLTGSFEGTVTFGSTNRSSHGGKDIFYAKLQGNSDMIDILSAERVVQVEERNYADVMRELYLFWADWIATPGLCDYGTYYCWILVGHFDLGCNPAICIDPRWALNANYVQTLLSYLQTASEYNSSYSAAVARISQIDNLLGNGVMSWQNATTLGGLNDDIGYGVAHDTLPETGHAFITGEFRNTATALSEFWAADPADYPIEAKGDPDILVAKLDYNGKLLWVKTAGAIPPEGDPSWAPQPTYAYSIAVDNQGTAFIAGSIVAQTGFGELEPIETNSDYLQQLEDQLIIANARLAEITDPGATAYGHYALPVAKYVLDVLGFTYTDDGPWDGTYYLSQSPAAIALSQAPNEFIAGLIDNPYNAGNDLEAMLTFVFGSGNWTDLPTWLQAWSDGNSFNGELDEIIIVIDVDGNITSMTWERDLANSKHILTEMGAAPVTFPYTSSVVTESSIMFDLVAIRNLLPANPLNPNTTQVAVAGTMRDGDCTNDELISVQFSNVGNDGTGDFLWNYISSNNTTAWTLRNIDSTVDLCTEFGGNGTISHYYNKTDFMTNYTQAGLAGNLASGTPAPAFTGSWATRLSNWTDGSDTNFELDSDPAVQYSYNPTTNIMVVTFYVSDDTPSSSIHTVTFNSTPNPYQTSTHSLTGTDTTLHTAGNEAYNQDQVVPRDDEDCPLAGNPAPCAWELYSIFQLEADELVDGIADIEAQIMAIGSGTQASNQDAMLAKISTDGIWARASAGGGPLNDTAWDVVSGNNGKIYVTGDFQRAAILGGLSPVTAIGTRDPYLNSTDADAYVTQLDSFLFGNFKRWVIGEEVRPPLAAINQSINAAWGPPVGVYDAQGDQVMDAFFWMEGDRPEDDKLFAIKPGSYSVFWEWELYGEYVPYEGPGTCDSGIMNIEGNCYISTEGIQPAIYGPIPSTGVNEWPAVPQYHIAGAPVDLNPPVNILPEDPEYMFHSLGYNHHDTMVVNNVYTNPVPDTYSVIIYMQNMKPSYIEVVYTTSFEESPRFMESPELYDQKKALVGSRVTDPFHEDNSGKNGYVLLPKARIDAVAYDREERTGPIITVNTSEDEFGQLAPTKESPNPTAANPAMINGIKHDDDDLVVAWYKINDIGTAWPELAVRYKPEWPSSVGKVIDFAVDEADVTPENFNDAYDFALDLKNDGMYWTDISTSQIMRTDRDGSRTSDTDTLLATFNITPGTPPYDLNAINSDVAWSHNFIGNSGNVTLLLPQLPTGPDDPEDWTHTFENWTIGSVGQGDVDGELINIEINVFADGSSEIDWTFDISTDVTDILNLFGHSDPFFDGLWPVTVDFNTVLGGSDVRTFLDNASNQEAFLLLLPAGVREPNWTRLLMDWTDGSAPDVNGEIDNIIMVVYEDGHGEMTFHYSTDNGGVQNLELDTVIDAQGGFHRSLITSLSGPKVLVSEGLIGPKGIDIDLVDEKIYWTDSTVRKIQRSNFNGTQVESVIDTRLEEPVGLALDTTPENTNDHRMYWTDPKAKKLYRAYLHDTRQRMTQGVLDLFQVAMGIYDFDEIYGQNLHAPYAGIFSDSPPFGGIYTDSWDFLTNNQTALANLLNGMAFDLDGNDVGDMSGDFTVWTNGQEVTDPELHNIHIAIHGNGSCELRFLLNQNTLITTETLQLAAADTYTLLAFFLEQLNFKMNTIFGTAFSYVFVQDPIQAEELIDALPPLGGGEPDWEVLFQSWTDGDPATGTMGDLIVHFNSDGSASFSATYTDAGGIVQTESTLSNVTVGIEASNLIGVFFNRSRTYNLDLINGNGASYEFLSQNLETIENFLLPIAFSDTFAYRTHELDYPGFLNSMFGQWTNGTFSDGEMSLIVIAVASDGSSKIKWQYDVENGYEIYETAIPGFEEIIGLNVEGPTRIALDLTDGNSENHMVYWVDMIPGQNRIQRAYLDGETGAETIVSDLVSPSGIALFDDKLYWSDFVTRQVYKAEMDGAYIEVHGFGGPFNAPKALNITTYTPDGGTMNKDSVLTDAGIDKIIIASQLGSEGLNQPILYPENFPEMTLYSQNDPGLAGFNPNDEHADFFPSTFGSGQNSIFALRDDLEGASQPYVLLKHKSLVDNDWTMKVYKVHRNGFGYDFSEYSGVAGNPFFAPYPVRLLGTCGDTSGSGEPYFEDYKFNTYAKSAGTITARFFYPLQTGFYWDETRHGPIKDGGCVAWLGGDIYNINSILRPDTSEEVLLSSSHSAVKNDVPRLAGILPTGPGHPNWGTLLSEWTNQEILGDYVLDSDTDGELENVMIEAYKDGTSRVTWTYWPEYPRTMSDPLKRITHVESETITQQLLDFFLFNHGHPDLDEKYVAPMEVIYNIQWPDIPPILTVGETLLFPKNGLPDIFNQAAVRVIYERPDGAAKDAPRSLVNLIDPLSPREVQLVSADLAGIPEDVAVENQVGKLVIVSNASGTILVPFSIRSRLSFDPVSGKLAFSGYMDTNVAGEPLLLVNVLSANERDLLKSLSNDTAYKAVIDNLYNYTRNPNELDMDYDGEVDQVYRLGLEEYCPYPQSICDDPLYGHFFKRFRPQSVVGLPKGLTAGAATGTGWVTLVFNDDSVLNPLPVSLNVFRVDCLEYSPNTFSPYIGEVKIILSDNIFDEQLTLRHSGDFGGNPFDDLNGNGVQDPGEFGLFFEWYYKPDENGVSPPPPEFDINGTIIPGSGWRPFDSGIGLQEITIEGANLTTLSDNWFFCRYKGYPVCRNDVEFTQLAGDPSSTPTAPRGVLAEGWIKRVIRRLNAFEARVQDFHSSPTNTYASMIGQLGERYEGPIAMNNDPSNLNAMGLIEAYETVLRRGMSLSIEGTPPINYGPANKALLFVANRIAGFYALLGNEAYADAVDPTIGFDTEGEMSYVAPTLFAFQNQQDSLLAEELALLRGRDDYSAGVAASPVYNRLYWNFTSGDGEVAYVQAYNIHDQDISGVVDETDARILFPQGHGDAWGHYLTSLNTFYKLLNHPYYTWEPRAEAVTVAGVAIQVDYEDERRFAEVAAQKAKTGAQIVNMTYREKYVMDPAGQWQGYKDSNEERAWGLSEWAKRAGQGAYVDWVVANSILPVEDLNNTGLEKIDRTSVFELQSIAGEFTTIQAELDVADSGNNPLGLAKGAIPFDIDPSEVDEGKTHFEQIYERAMGNIANTLVVFDQANNLSNMLRFNQDSVDEFTSNVYDQDFDFMSRLIEIFGYPYEGDIGPGGTYPTGYDGPDIFHFNYIDYEKLTGQNLGRIETWTTEINNAGIMNFWLADFYDPTGLDPSFREDPIDKWTDVLKEINTVTYHFVDPDDDPDTPTISFHDFYHNSHTREIGLVKPDPSWGERQANGEIQFTLSELIREIAQMDVALNEYDRHIDTMMGTVVDIEQKYKYEVARGILQWGYFGVATAIDLGIAVGKVVRAVMRGILESVDTIKEVGKEAPPGMVGVASDVFSAIRAASETVGGGIHTGITIAHDVIETVEDIAGMAKDTLGSIKDLTIEEISARHDMGVFIREFEAQVRMEPGLRLELYIQLDRIKGKVAAYKAAVNKGNRLIDELIVFRKNAAAVTQDHRYRDMFFRIMRNSSLQKYHAQFELAAKYVYLAASAYDYETNLLGTNQMAGRDFLTNIVKQRNLGELMWTWEGVLVPLAGPAGLADPMARMKANFDVLKPQLGFNNPQIETNRFSIRQQLFRILPGSQQTWMDELSEHRVADLWRIPEFKRYCRPFTPQEQGPQPGIVIPFTTNVTFGMNYFGWPLGNGDSAYDPSHFATRIRSVGVWFTGYDELGLSQTPRVYLIPAGMDVLRSPDATNFETREWHIVDQKLPLPLPLTVQDVEEPDWIPIHHSLSDDIYDIRQFSAFRAYDDSGEFDPDEVTTDTRLIGRSVWNTRWLLIIPGGYMLEDADLALDTFIQGIGDINFFFETYAYSGNKKTEESEAEAEATEQQETGEEVRDDQ